MGVQPLPADLRKICDCTGGAEKTWQGPEKRIWLRWPLASPVLYPGLADGVLAEIVDADITVQICKWTVVPISPIIVRVELTRTGQSPFTGTGFEWLVFVRGTGNKTWSGQVVLPAEDTPLDAQPLRFFEDFDPELGVICDLTQVLWWENADDVPH